MVLEKQATKGTFPSVVEPSEPDLQLALTVARHPIHDTSIIYANHANIVNHTFSTIQSDPMYIARAALIYAMVQMRIPSSTL